MVSTHFSEAIDEISIAPVGFWHAPKRDALTGPGRSLAGKNLPDWQAAESAFLFFHPDTPRRDALTGPGRSPIGKNLPDWQAAESACHQRDALTGPECAFTAKNLPDWQAAESAFLFH